MTFSEFEYDRESDMLTIKAVKAPFPHLFELMRRIALARLKDSPPSLPEPLHVMEPANCSS